MEMYVYVNRYSLKQVEIYYIKEQKRRASISREGVEEGYQIESAVKADIISIAEGSSIEKHSEDRYVTDLTLLSRSLIGVSCLC